MNFNFNFKFQFLIFNFNLQLKFAIAISISVANSAAKEVRVAFFLEWATPNQEDKVKKAFDKSNKIDELKVDG